MRMRRFCREFEELIREDFDPNASASEEMETAMQVLPEMVTKLTAAYRLT